MSISLMTDVWKLSLQAPRKMVLLALADNANDEGTDCWPSVGKLVEKCSMSERAVQGHLAALEEEGYIKRHERLGRSNKFTIHVDRIRLEILQKVKASAETPAESAPPAKVPKLPPQNLHPYPSNPHGIHTPAESAPPQSLHPTPAESAPITTRESSLKTTTTSSDAIESCGGDLSIEKLHYPVCSQEESIAIADLVANCPANLRQKALDEIEGARQAGVIKTNLVPFARGIMTAIARGTFTVGHGIKVVDQRTIQAANNNRPDPSAILLDPEFIDKGKAFMNRHGIGVR
ncbi:MAG: helix-turn-helix domain-containing protein [Fluviibacter phosphoraccumulans]